MNRVKKEAQNRRYAHTPDGSRVDLREGATVSEDEWFRLLNAANPLDRALQTQAAFARIEPPVEAVKFYRQSTDYHLLHRGTTPITTLRYRAIEYDVNMGRVQHVRLCALHSLPQQSHVQIGAMDLPRFRRVRAELLEVEWEGGQTWRGRRALRMFEPTGGIPGLDGLDLSEAPSDPFVLDTFAPNP
jgi:hypothetical protein